MSKTCKLLIFFIIVQNKNKNNNNNKVILRTLEVNSRGQKEKSNFYNSASAIDSGMLQRSFTSLLKLILKFLDVFNHNFWNSVWPIILNGVYIFYANHVFLEIDSAEIIFWYGLRNSKGKIFHCCDSLSYDWKKNSRSFRINSAEQTTFFV